MTIDMHVAPRVVLALARQFGVVLLMPLQSIVDLSVKDLEWHAIHVGSRVGERLQGVDFELEVLKHLPGLRVAGILVGKTLDAGQQRLQRLHVHLPFGVQLRLFGIMALAGNCVLVVFHQGLRYTLLSEPQQRPRNASLAAMTGNENGEQEWYAESYSDRVPVHLQGCRGVMVVT
jgi:hypothetical protein